MIWLDRVIAHMSVWRRFEREAESDGVIHRAGEVVNHAKRERARPAPQVAVKRVVLLLQTSVLRVEIVRRTQTPVVVHAVKQRAGDEIFATDPHRGKVVVQIPMAESPTPLFVRREGELMEREV